MSPPRPLEVRLWGERAVFTRPEFKAERASYPLMTPSAARGALESIYWRPEFDWVIQEIHVLQPIRFFSILRNELNGRQTERVARSWAVTGGGYDASSSQERAQRHTLGLRDVAYLVRAQIRLRPHATDDPAKYRDQFRRRVERGSCWSIPYFGCREFAASFGPPIPGEVAQPINEDLGSMLLDLDFKDDSSGRGSPRFFEAHLLNGVLHVPNRFAEVD